MNTSRLKDLQRFLPENNEEVLQLYKSNYTFDSYTLGIGIGIFYNFCPSRLVTNL